MTRTIYGWGHLRLLNCSGRHLCRLTFFLVLLSVFGRLPLLAHAQSPIPAPQHNPQAQAHRDQGGKLRTEGDFVGVLREYQAAYDLDKDNPAFRQDAGIDLRQIGNAYLNLSKYEKAIGYYQQALTIYQQMKDRNGEAYALNNLGNAYRYMDQYDKAIQYLQQALTIFQQVKDKTGEADAIGNLGTAYAALSQYDKAIQYFQQVLPIFQQVKDLNGQADTLTNLGIAYRALSQYAEAIQYFQQALTIDQEVKDKNGQADDLTDLGNAYRGMSQYAKAIQYLQQALPIFQQVKDKTGEAGDLTDLGNVYLSLSQYAKAIGYYQQGLTIVRQVKDQDGEAGEFTNLGNAYLALNQYNQAIRYFQQALSIDQEVKDRNGQAYDFTGLSHAYIGLKQYEKAIQYGRLALTVDRQVKDQEGAANDLTNLGHAYLDLSQYEKAIGYYQQALPIYEQIQDRNGEAGSLNGLMNVWTHHANPYLAVFYGKQAVNVYQSIRQDIHSMEKETQKDYLKANEPTYRQLADLLIQQGRLPEALQILNMLKQEEYLNFTQNTRQQTALLAEQVQLTPAETNWTAQYQAASNQLATLGEKSRALGVKKHRTPAEIARLAILDRQSIQAAQKLDRTLAKIRTGASKINNNQDRLEAQADAARLQQTLSQLGHHSIAVYTLAGDESLRMMLVTPTKITAYTLPITAKDLDKKINGFRAMLQDPNDDPRPFGKDLYDLLVKPMEADLGDSQAQTLMWSLDGSLRYIPVAALYDGQHYLVERYTNTLFSPASDTLLTADPQARWTGLGVGVSQPHPGFEPLINVPAELESVIHDPQVAASQTGTLPGTILLDGQFTQAALLTGLSHHDPLVHIASHFAFAPGDVKDSFLLLGDGSHLSLADLQAMPDDLLAGVNLLTLSACETAADGAGANGKEVENLAVLAQRKGAQAVMATLWSVDDAATQQLMHDFYGGRQTGAGMSKGDALRQAQLSILGDASLAAATVGRGANRAQIVPGGKHPAGDAPTYRLDPAHPQVHPYYWAPFILIGNWK